MARTARGAEVARHTSIPVATGERLMSKYEFADLLGGEAGHRMRVSARFHIRRPVGQVGDPVTQVVLEPQGAAQCIQLGCQRQFQRAAKAITAVALAIAVHLF